MDISTIKNLFHKILNLMFHHVCSFNKYEINISRNNLIGHI